MADNLRNLIPNPKNSSSSRGLLNQIKLILRLMADPRVSLLLKSLPVFALLYMISPLDAFLPVIDDAIIMGLGLYTFVELCPDDVVAEHRAALDAEALARRNKDDRPSGE